jgi:cytochrome c2
LLKPASFHSNQECHFSTMSQKKLGPSLSERVGRITVWSQITHKNTSSRFGPQIPSVQIKKTKKSNDGKYQKNRCIQSSAWLAQSAVMWRQLN